MRFDFDFIGEDGDLALKIYHEKQQDLEILVQEFRDRLGGIGGAIKDIDWEHGEVEFSGAAYPDGSWSGSQLSADHLKEIADLLPEFLQRGRVTITYHDERLRQARFEKSWRCDHEFLLRKYEVAVSIKGGMETIAHVLCPHCGMKTDVEITSQIQDEYGTLLYVKPEDGNFYVHIPNQGYALVMRGG